MGKIGKVEKYSDALKKTIAADIYYHMEKNRHGNSGFFFAEIPKECNTLYEQFEGATSFYNRGVSKIIIQGKSADDVMVKLGEYLKMYQEASSTTTKVILYRFEFSSRTKSSDPEKKNSRSFTSLEKSLEAKVEFDFDVFEKTDFHGKLTYKSTTIKKEDWRTGRDAIRETGNSTGAGYGGWVEIPYTEEAEAFFSQVYTGLEGIMDKLMKFLHTKEQVTMSIKNHQKLLA